MAFKDDLLTALRAVENPSRFRTVQQILDEVLPSTPVKTTGDILAAFSELLGDESDTGVRLFDTGDPPTVDIPLIGERSGFDSTYRATT